MSVCEAPRCFAAVRWLKNDRTDKPAPIDTMPNPIGNVILVDAEHYHVLTKKEIMAMENPGMFDDPAPDRFTSHFATCRQPEYYRYRCGRCHKRPCVCLAA